ncbi:MAG: glycosyltransferase family 2 protein [Armatimonadota bacterium]
MDKPICICIVNYNQGKWLPRAIASALASTVADSLEIIVVDAASTDDGVSAAREQFPHVRCVEMEHNRGYATALNRGLGETSAPLVVCGNADIEFAPDALALLRDALLSRESVGAAAPRFVFGDGTPQESIDAFPSIFQILRMALLPTSRTRPAPETGDADPVDTSLGACVMYRRECLEQLGGFDEGIFLYYEEVDLHRRLRDAGLRLLVVPDAVVIHHAGQATGGATVRNVQQHLVSLFYYLRKHGGRRRELLGRTILAGGYLARLVVSIALLPVLVVWALARGDGPIGVPAKYAALLRCCLRGWQQTERGAEPRR